MNIEPRDVQIPRERTIRNTLEEDRGVRKAVEKVRERTSGFGLVRRRRLLTNALRLTPEIAPEIAELLDRARDVVGVEEPVEVYVRPNPMFNAFCFRDPMGLLVIGLSSQVVEEFTPSELEFVIGHELAHAYFEHFTIPMPETAVVEDMAGPMVSRPMALKLYLWCRLAELTADRIGLLCSRDSEAAVSSFFKLASGTSSDRLEPNLEAFASQVESLAAAPEAREEPRKRNDALGCFSTHPYSPSRVRALLAFSKSRPYLDMTDAEPPENVLSEEDLKQIVNRDIDVMEPSYLEEKTANSRLMRDLLYQAGMLVAAADGTIREEEIKALQSLLGSDRVHEDREVLPEEDVEKLRKQLDENVEKALDHVSLTERARLVQHLTIISASDGETDNRELAEMNEIARKLEVNPSIINQTLSAAARPIGDFQTPGMSE